MTDIFKIRKRTEPRTGLVLEEAFVYGIGVHEEIDYEIRIDLPGVMGRNPDTLEIVRTRQPMRAVMRIDAHDLRRALNPRSIQDEADREDIEKKRDSWRRMLNEQLQDMLWRAFKMIIEESKLEGLAIFDEDEEPLYLDHAGGLEGLVERLIRRKGGGL